MTLIGLVLALGLFVASFFVSKRLRTFIPHRAEPPKEKRFWYRWSRIVQHRPWPAAIGAAGLLILLAVPLLSIRLGFGDYGNVSENQTVRRAYDLLAEGFGPGSNGPIFITVQGDIVADEGGVEQLAADIEAVDDQGEDLIAATFVPPAPADDLGMVIVYPASAPQDAEATQLVHDLRDDILPTVTRHQHGGQGGRRQRRGLGLRHATSAGACRCSSVSCSCSASCC